MKKAGVGQPKYCNNAYVHVVLTNLCSIFSIFNIIIVHAFKLAVVHFASPNEPKPDADQCMRVDLLLDKKTVENQDQAAGPLWGAGQSQALGRGPRGLQAVAGHGPVFSKTL